MSAELCTSEQAIAAVGYLRHCFGGWPIPEQEERAHLRLYRSYTPAQVREAIDVLVRKSDRRPSPNDIARAIRKPDRPKPQYLHDVPESELTPAQDIGGLVAQLRDPGSELRKVDA